METYRAFGLTICSEFPLPGMPPLPAHQRPDVVITLTDSQHLQGAWSGSCGVPDAVAKVHGGLLRSSQGKAGDCLLAYADHAQFHISPNAERILCLPTEPVEMQWQRELLDTVLWLAALAHGYEALHASAVEVGAGVVAIVAPSGGGKTSLAAELMRHGCRFFCDDVLVFERAEDRIQAHPGPPLMNLPAQFADRAAPRWGKPVARIDEEVWIAVEGAAERPRPLAALCFLERRGTDPQPELSAIQPSVTDLLPHMLAHPWRAGREAATFLIGSELVTTVPTWRLCAPSHAPSELLAEPILELLGRVGDLRFEQVA